MFHRPTSWALQVATIPFFLQLRYIKVCFSMKWRSSSGKSYRCYYPIITCVCVQGRTVLLKSFTNRSTIFKHELNDIHKSLLAASFKQVEACTWDFLCYFYYGNIWTDALGRNGNCFHVVRILFENTSAKRKKEKETDYLHKLMQTI